MARLVGYFSNQPDRIQCALALDGGAVPLAHEAGIDGWGVGSYHGAEVLLRRKPTALREALALGDVVKDLRTDCAIVHVRKATVGNNVMENTQPFRVRQWLFAHTGTVPSFAALRPTLLARVPDFLQRTIRGETDSELLFALFLAFVHDTGRMDDPELDRKTITGALRQYVAFVDAATDEAHVERASLNCVVTNHTALVALQRGLPMHWMRRHGIRDCAVCRKAPEIAGREPKRMDHEALKYVLIASDHPVCPDHWYEVPGGTRGAVVAVDRALDAEIVEF